VSKGEATTTVESKGLKGGALGLVSSIVVGMASTAPAYSLAATLGLIVASGGALLSGVKAPAIVLISFIPMYLIAVAYQELNKAEPDCGTTFTWASRAFGPFVGWLGGWGIIAADVIVMANLAQIAGAYSFTFVGDLGWHSVAGLASSTVWSTVAGVIWIALMTYICYRGIEVSARLQYGLLSIEIVVLVVLSVVALIKVYTHNAEDYSLLPSLSWFWPGGMDFSTVIAPAVLTTIFIYWGWDTAVACNEESDDPGRTPGRAAVISTFLLLATYALVTVATIAFAGVGTDGIGLGNSANSADVFTAIGPDLFGNSFIGHIGLLLLSVSILTSASASTQTTILPTARTTLSMGVYKALPDSFARIHRRYLTPSVSTLLMGVVSAVFYVLFTVISKDLLTALIGSVGLMIAFYYGLTGFACVWFYRNTLTSSPRDLLMRGIVPLLGGVILLVIFMYGLIQYAKPSWLTDAQGNNVTIFGYGAVAVVGIGALVLGVILMVVWRVTAPGFFKGIPLPRRSHDLLLEPVTASTPHFGLPDSGDMPTLISPDLSNLPPGETALDPETGDEFTKS
jgi:amino acid transporter